MSRWTRFTHLRSQFRHGVVTGIPLEFQFGTAPANPDAEITPAKRLLDAGMSPLGLAAGRWAAEELEEGFAELAAEGMARSICVPRADGTIEKRWSFTSKEKAPPPLRPETLDRN